MRPLKEILKIIQTTEDIESKMFLEDEVRQWLEKHLEAQLALQERYKILADKFTSRK